MQQPQHALRRGVRGFFRRIAESRRGPDPPASADRVYRLRLGPLREVPDGYLGVDEGGALSFSPEPRSELFHVVRAAQSPGYFTLQHLSRQQPVIFDGAALRVGAPADLDEALFRVKLKSGSQFQLQNRKHPAADVSLGKYWTLQTTYPEGRGSVDFADLSAPSKEACVALYGLTRLNSEYTGPLAEVLNPPTVGFTATDGAIDQSTMPEDSAVWTNFTHSPELGLFLAFCRIPYIDEGYTGAPGEGEGRGYTSPDGVNWTPIPYTFEYGVYSCAWSSTLGMFIAGSANGRFGGSGNPAKLYKSTDGVHWEVVHNGVFSLGTVYVWDLILEHDGQFFAYPAYQNFSVATSPDGVTWTEHAGWVNRLNSYAYSPSLNLFIYTSPDAYTRFSTDGINLQTREYGGNTFHVTSVAWSGKHQAFFATTSWSLRTAFGNQMAVIKSTDGATWTPVFIGQNRVDTSWGDWRVSYSEVFDALVLRAPWYSTKISLDGGATWTVADMDHETSFDDFTVTPELFDFPAAGVVLGQGREVDRSWPYGRRYLPAKFNLLVGGGSSPLADLSEVAPGTKLVTWYDQSGRGRHAVSRGDAEPELTGGRLHFAGGAYLEAEADLLVRDFTLALAEGSEGGVELETIAAAGDQVAAFREGAVRGLTVAQTSLRMPRTDARTRSVWGRRSDRLVGAVDDLEGTARLRRRFRNTPFRAPRLTIGAGNAEGSVEALALFEAYLPPADRALVDRLMARAQ